MGILSFPLLTHPPLRPDSMKIHPLHPREQSKQCAERLKPVMPSTSPMGDECRNVTRSDVHSVGGRAR